MIAAVPESVFYIDDLGSAFSEIDLPNKTLTLRVYRTKDEAAHAKDVLSVFFGIKSIVATNTLTDVLASARDSEEHIRVVLCEYDVLGELIEAETLLDPRATVS